MEEKNIITEEQRREWFTNWEKMMMIIWHDRMRKYRIHRTGALRSSIASEGTTFSNDAYEIKIIHNFLTYGIYVDLGTGKEFGGARYTENKGLHRRGQLVKEVNRTPKPWFSKAYYRSAMVAKEFMAEAVGDRFKAILFKTARQIAKELRSM